MNSIPSLGRKLSKHSKYSCVPPGPPCNSNTLIRGLFPIRLVHTWNLPLGVLISTIFIPPVCKPESAEDKYSAQSIPLCGLWQQAKDSASRRTRGILICDDLIAVKMAIFL